MAMPVLKIKSAIFGLFISFALMCYCEIFVGLLAEWLDYHKMQAGGFEFAALLNAIVFGALFMVLEIVKCAAGCRIFLPLNFIFLFFALASPFLLLTSPDFILFGLVSAEYYPFSLIFLLAYLLPLAFYLFAWYIVENRSECVKKTQAALFFLFVLLNVLFYANYLYEFSASFAPSDSCGSAPQQAASANGELNN